MMSPAIERPADALSVPVVAFNSPDHFVAPALRAGTMNCMGTARGAATGTGGEGDWREVDSGPVASAAGGRAGGPEGAHARSGRDAHLPGESPAVVRGRPAGAPRAGTADCAAPD